MPILYKYHSGWCRTVAILSVLSASVYVAWTETFPRISGPNVSVYLNMLSTGNKLSCVHQQLLQLLILGELDVQGTRNVTEHLVILCWMDWYISITCTKLVIIFVIICMRGKYISPHFDKELKEASLTVLISTTILWHIVAKVYFL